MQSFYNMYDFSTANYLSEQTYHTLLKSKLSQVKKSNFNVFWKIKQTNKKNKSIIYLIISALEYNFVATSLLVY